MFAEREPKEIGMSAQSEKLVTDVKVLVNDTEELVKATASQAGEKIVDIRNRAQEAVANLKPQLAQLETAVVSKAKSTATATHAYIDENPWSAIGISAGIGLVIGLLIGRR
jgi:ElaB/YqjD/DUF883 family membrane-anchored ribosome-binding protein